MAHSDLRSFLTRELSRERLVALDCLVAALYAAILIAYAVTDADGRVPALPVWSRCLVAAAIALPVAVRRLWPVPVFAVVLAVSVVSMVANVLDEPVLAAAYALYPVALTTPRRTWVPTSAIAVVSAFCLFVGTLALPPSLVSGNVGIVVFGAAALGGGWTIGRAVAERRAYAGRRAEGLATQAVAEERLRIARELHDIVTHGMGLIAVKAAVANHVFTVRPQEAHDALRVIEATSRMSLVEMRNMLALLRSEPSADELGPVPGLARLPDLVATAAGSGVEVELSVCGEDRLPEGLGVSVYRIVQEALTNVAKHAGPARCRVSIETTGPQVRIDVVDDGAGARAHGGAAGEPGGHGLIGMRERVAMFGGTLVTGPRPDGGFAVSACLPYQPVEVGGAS
ncbi:sensor histidine kinase [Actinophytocola oryzae]|uniref:histidine kinase n=1 Tax=Actinophytocola oryzae TaxID=502181 RepID=A0A4R7VKA6_9PSEU|nr:sensor histidine kinase [Actinophytocola oryzae]TDV49677.1 signal transduction histidine kinase [Actinophytocola oryzae]